MAENSPSSPPQRFFRGCLYVLGGIVALWLALELLAQFWGWILLAAAIALAVWTSVVSYQLWRDRR